MIKKYRIIFTRHTKHNICSNLPPMQYIKNQILRRNSKNCANPHIQCENKSRPLIPPQYQRC